MTALSPTLKPLLTDLRSRASYFARPVALARSYNRSDLQPDLLAGLTVAVVLLPQSIVFALIAGLPPSMGLYAAIIGAVAGGLWGSSNQLHSGPTNTHSLLTLSVLSAIMVAGGPDYIAAAGLLAIMVGVFRLLVGLLRLGVLANFVSDSVIVGFTAGAGALIAVNQLRHLFRLDFATSPNLLLTLQRLAQHLPETHLISLGLSLGTMLIVLAIDRFAPKLPSFLLAMIAASAAVAVLGLNQVGVNVVGELPRSLPPLASLPLLDLDLIGQLSMGAFAIGAIGLVEATSISRAMAAKTGQRLDSNQEFVGQGITSIAVGLFSGYPTSASFNRSSVNLQAGARTPLAAIFSGLITLVIMITLAPLAVYIPQAALAGSLIIIAYRMIDRAEMARIWRSTRGEAAIMTATLLATLFLPLQFAVLTGILMSLAYYILKTGAPSVLTVLPDDNFRHVFHQPGHPQCPQLGMIEIRGDLYFGAANHVEDAILDNKRKNPGQRYLLLRLNNVQHLDISGVHMLEAVVRSYRDAGGDVFMVKARPNVKHRMETTGFEQFLGEDHFLEEDAALSHIFYHVLDPAICIYECEIRAFRECQNLPRPTYQIDLPPAANLSDDQFDWLDPSNLFSELRSDSPPLVIDVREPREFRRAHIPQAQNIPLSTLLINPPDLPRDQPIVLSSRASRRSRRAAYALQQIGHENIRILDNGMIGWEAANLFETVESMV